MIKLIELIATPRYKPNVYIEAALALNLGWKLSVNRLKHIGKHALKAKFWMIRGISIWIKLWAKPCKMVVIDHMRAKMINIDTQ